MKTSKYPATRINRDGNPRYVVHFLAFLTLADKDECQNEATRLTNAGQLTFCVPLMYERALQRARRVGGKKFHNKQYGGGIVFQCYGQSEIDALIKQAKIIKL